MEANREASEEALRLARERREAGDEDEALRLVEKSLRLFDSSAAQELLDDLHRFGKGSTFASEIERTRASTTHYETLRLEPTASVDEIQRAYRALSRKLHPDKNQAVGAKEAFTQLSTAHETLKDPRLRREYDARIGVARGNPFPKPDGICISASCWNAHATFASCRMCREHCLGRAGARCAFHQPTPRAGTGSGGGGGGGGRGAGGATSDADAAARRAEMPRELIRLRSQLRAAETRASAAESERDALRELSLIHI